MDDKAAFVGISWKQLTKQCMLTCLNIQKSKLVQSTTHSTVPRMLLQLITSCGARHNKPHPRAAVRAVVGLSHLRRYALFRRRSHVLLLTSGLRLRLFTPTLSTVSWPWRVYELNKKQHCGIERFTGIDPKLNQVVPWSLHTFPENFMQIGPAVFS